MRGAVGRAHLVYAEHRPRAGVLSDDPGSTTKTHFVDPIDAATVKIGRISGGRWGIEKRVSLAPPGVGTARSVLGEFGAQQVASELPRISPVTRALAYGIRIATPPFVAFAGENEVTGLGRAERT